MLLFLAWLLAAVGIAWWAFPFGVMFSMPFLAAAAFLWRAGFERTPAAGPRRHQAAVLRALALVLVLAPAVALAPYTNWALLSAQRGIASDASVKVVWVLLASMALGAAAGALQALAVRWRTGDVSRSPAATILTMASFGPAVAAFTWGISRFWDLSN